MCGIFGSLDYDAYKSIYADNCVRGNFAGGSLYVNHKSHNYSISKWPGVLHDSDLDCHDKQYINHDIYLGHTQAPTSMIRAYDERTTHPFVSKDWVVAHNGILENHLELRKSINSDICSVDSAVIPELLQLCMQDTVDDIDTISLMASKLKGTFGCWIFSRVNREVYIIRSGSTIYTNKKKNEFTSTRTTASFQPLQEGEIYNMTQDGLKSVGDFKYSSPFFVL